MERLLSTVCLLVVLAFWPLTDLGAAEPPAEAASAPASDSGAAARPTRAAAETTRFDRIIREQASRHGVRPELVRAMIAVESSYDPRAVSPKGAQGLMQLMPATAAAFRVTDPFDPSENIRGGVAYLGRLLRRYDNDETLALAAYNAGPAAVERYGNRVPPYRETTRYIHKVHAMSRPAPPPATTLARKVIYRVETGTGTPTYTNIRPAGSARYAVVGTRR